MEQIFKYELKPNGPKTLIPAGAEVLSAGVQGKSIFIWAKVDPKKPMVARDFHVFGTGHLIPDNLELKFINTVFMRDLVFHVFEDIRR